MRPAHRRFNPAQTRAARALIAWSIDRLAEAAGLETEALRLFEACEADLGEVDLDRLAAAIHDAGVVPIAAALAGEGVRLRFAHCAESPERARAAPAKGLLPEWIPLRRVVR